MTCMTTEIECPYFQQCSHTEVPLGYIPQIQSGMAVTNSPSSLFVSYNKLSTSVFICKRDELYFDNLIGHIKTTFIAGKIAMKNVKFSDFKKVNDNTKLGMQFLAEVLK